MFIIHLTAQQTSKLLTMVLALSILFLAGASNADNQLTIQLDKILDAPALQGGIAGAIVERVTDRRVLYAHNAETRLIPASNQKLFTSAAALELLGDNFTLETDITATANSDLAGILHGDLYLRGVGDSLLTPTDFDTMAKQIAQAGVKQITGDIFGDGTLFTDGPYGSNWAWDYLSEPYAMQISGLEVSEGTVAATVQAGVKSGDPVTVTLDPVTKYLPIVNNAHTGDKDSSLQDCKVYRPWNKNILIVEGTLPIGGKVENTVTVAEPDRYAAAVFAEALTRNGIVISGGAYAGKTPPTATIILAAHTSLPMGEYIAKMNKKSDNLMAESLVRILGAAKGKGGNFNSGLAVELPFFKSLGIDTIPLTFDDGSGLSRRNFVTPRSLVQLLCAMYRKPDWQTFYNSLPVAGIDGSLRRLKGTVAAGNVHAKTGSLGSVSALSGYVTGAQGDIYAFSLLLNNYPGNDHDVSAAQGLFVIELVTALIERGAA